MSYALVGPFAFDTGAVLARGREALASVQRRIRDERLAELLARNPSGEQPGLYVLLSEGEGGSRIAGFWVTFASTWFDDGTPGPPDRHPPYAGGLLDAATEEVWWKNLTVTDDGRGTWSPVIVLEWPAEMAVRAAHPPPGVHARARAQQRGRKDEDENWLETTSPGRTFETKPAVVEVKEEREDPYAGVPARRSLITVVRGQLTYDRSLHRGHTTLVPPGVFSRATRAPSVALDDWLGLAAGISDADAQQALTDTPVLGPPLVLPGGRAGFAQAGWLTRALDLWPARPIEIVPGALSDRVVRTKWVGQVARALASMAAVLTMVGGLAVGVRIAAEPNPQPSQKPPAPAPQPAMSVCSADHQKFVDELRCQISRLSQTGETFPDDPWCGDDGSGESTTVSNEDLQAAWCGLLDRSLDGWEGNRVEREATYNFGELAAAQACFNVLGHPYPYAQPLARGGGMLVADPSRFLDDEALSIASLRELTTTLEKACKTYRARAESRVEGAVFATHVGAPFNREDRFAGGQKESSSAALRRLMVSVAAQGQSGDAVRCFDEGVHEGLSSDRYAGLCGDVDRVDEDLGATKIWKKLGGETPAGGQGVLARYVSSRFGLGGETPNTKVSTDVALWQCHLTLTGAIPSGVGRAVPTLWDLTLPVPATYSQSGGVQRQLQLDAALGAFEQGLDAGICWEVVRKRLISYSPVHPLLASLDPEGWPSEEQQLCGQVCATVFRVATSLSEETWVTPDADLAMCYDNDPPVEGARLGRGSFDELRVPWHGLPATGWRTPSAAQVCAFNLVAQNYFPAGDEGFLVGGKSPVQWAGETTTGSRIAGGADGLAADSIGGMMRSNSGSGWSVGRCGHVATQCFASVAMETMGDPKTERYEWLLKWSTEVERLANDKPIKVAEAQPWCAPIQPYLSLQREMAQFDAPCRQGVNTARANMERAIRQFAQGNVAQAAAGGE